LYEVKVIDVRTQNRRGKPRRTKNKVVHASNWKRAMVVLAENSTIELF
jgi:large subunit ribosomal protein L23